MSISKPLEKYLKQSKVKYEVVPHKKVFTVYDLAQTLRLKLESVAKTLLVKVDQRYVLVVVPAHYRLDFGKLKKVLKARKVDIAREKDMEKFKVKPGAMMPFGAIHKLDLVADKSLMKAKEALFSAGSFTESVRMKLKDYVRLATPLVADIGKKFPIKLQVVKKTSKKKHAPGKRRPKGKAKRK